MRQIHFFRFLSSTLVGTTETIQIIEEGVPVDKIVNKVFTTELFPDISNGIDNVYLRCNVVETQYNQ